MRPDRKLTKLERALAIVLALIWLAWTRVAVRSRLLTWPSLFAPWRSGNG